MEEISRETAIELLKARNPPDVSRAVTFLEMMSDLFPIMLHRGALERSSSFVVDRIAIIDGDLVIDGLMDIEDGTDHGVCCLVLGDLRADALVFEGALFVARDLRVKSAIYYDGLDWAGYVRGDLEADLVIERNGHLHVRGQARVKAPCDLDQFVDGLTYRDGNERMLDPAPVMAALRAGRPLLQDRSAS